MSKKRQQRDESHDRPLEAVATVTRVAEMVGLSRERFYQLVREGIFPAPQRHGGLKRPCYTDEEQRACLAVRRTGVGVNGRPVLFNAKRHPRPAKPAGSADVPQSPDVVRPLIEGVRALGLDATAAQVEAGLRACFPDGTDGADEGAVVVAVFRHLYQQQNDRRV